jgi:HAE1 family hydrophobic/amphiphilic exporter-1
LEAIIFTALIMYLFLRSWRSSLIVLISIPTSLIATFLMMYLFGFSINIITILALSLCIGILVDDSIVVLENIERHRKLGKNPVQAAIEGRGEIGMAAIAITMCDVVVFGPVAFLTDIVGQFFRQFGITVVVATLFSLAVSFTITPMLTVKMMKASPAEKTAPSESNSVQTGFLDRIYSRTLALYKRFLVWALDNRWKVVGIITAGVVLSAALIPLGYIKSEFMPQTDQASFTINLALAPGSNLKQTDDKVQILEQHLQSMPEIDSYLAQIGSSDGDDQTKATVTVNLLPKGERSKHQAQIVRELRDWGNRLSGVDFTIIEDSLIGKTSVDGSKPIAINVYGTDYEVLQDIAGQVETIVKSVPGTEDVDNSDKGSQSEYQINIDRVLASQMGLSTAEIASTLRAAINGANAGLYRCNGDEYDIIVRIKDSQIKTVHDIGSIRISNASGQTYRLEEMAAISRGNSAGELLRRDRQRLITISADIQGRALGDIDKDIGQKLEALDLPAGVTVKFGGDQQNMRTGFSSLIKALIVSIILYI